MQHPLEVHYEDSEVGETLVSARHKRARSDSRFATLGAGGVTILAISAAASGVSVMACMLVVCVALCIARATNVRLLRLERDMWWHSARASLLESNAARMQMREAVENVFAEDNSGPDAQIIDLRERAAVLRGN